MEGGTEIFLLTCMHVEDHRNLHELVHGHAMKLERSIIETVLLGNCRNSLLPCIDSALEQLLISCDGICPEQAFNIYDETVHGKSPGSIRQEVLFQSHRNSRITCRLVICLDSPEEYRKRPCSELCLGSQTSFRTLCSRCLCPSSDLVHQIKDNGTGLRIG